MMFPVGIIPVMLQITRVMKASPFGRKKTGTSVPYESQL